MNTEIVIHGSVDSKILDIKKALPSGVSFDAFTRAANIAIASSQDLAIATPDSLVISLSRCAADGLVPDGREAALVVFSSKIKVNGREEWVKKAQYMPMVDGVLKRARMSGEVSTIQAKVVKENDEFDYWIDEEGEHFKHRPCFGDGGQIKLVYAFARMKSGDLIFEAMDKADIDRVRAASKGGDYGPWKDWYDRMACKSVLHRLARRLPNASEMVQMLEIGQQMNFKKEQNEKVVNEKEFIVDLDHAITKNLELKGKSIDEFLSWCGKMVKPQREVLSLDSLTEGEKAHFLGKLEAQG